MNIIRGITGIRRAVLTALAVLLCIPLNSSAEVTFTTLAPIEHGLRLPEDVAIAPDGTAYAVEGSRGMVMVYNRNGAPAGNIRISGPTSVAVNTNGLIYVGTNENLSVKILDATHNVIGSLGSGAGEFKLPRNIAIDKETGNVYVVDQIDQAIKVYTSGGTFVRKISDYPNLPQDVTVMGNKIYVIDHPLITDPWGGGGTIRGAKVRVFDMAGNVLDAEAFGSYGEQEGQFIRPAGITSDADDVLYISDSFHGVVMCFQADGTYLGAIRNASNPMVTPMGIAAGEDRRLLVASLNTASIHAFGLEGYTEPGEIEVTPSSLTFAVEQGQSNPSAQNLTIRNTGSGTKTYNASKNKDWIVLATNTVTIASESTGIIPVEVNASGFNVGIYNGQVTITDGTGALANIPVTLEVTTPVAHAALSVSPDELDFIYKIGDITPSSRTVTVELTNDDGTTGWTAETDAEWISFVPSTGQVGSTTFATVSLDPAGLDAGDHAGVVTVSAPGADGSPATVTITLSVLHGGEIQVTCNIEGASFSIEGPEGAPYEGSGETWSVSEVPDGTYTITYNQVIGYRTPPSETKELSGAGTITFEGTYVSLALSSQIVITPGIDTGSPPTIGIFNEEGTMVFSFTPFSNIASGTSDTSSGGRGKKTKPTTASDSEGTVTTAVGDIDGNGEQDIVAALRVPKSSVVNIASYRADGTLIEGSDFTVSSESDGTEICVADFDGDGKAEIVVGIATVPDGYLKKSKNQEPRQGKPEYVEVFSYPDGYLKKPKKPEPRQGNPAYVKIFSYNPGGITDTGISLNACTGSVNVAAGDVDGDNTAELITVPGPGTSDNPEVRVWKIDASGGPGNWSVIDTGIRFTAFSGKYGANVTTGDLDGDGTDEIIVSSGPDPKGKRNIIKAFHGDGTEFGLEIIDSTKRYGLNVAAGDLDNDGIAEIVAGLGPSPYNYSTVKIFKADGTIMNNFEAFAGTCYGAYVSVGNLGY